MEKEAREKKKRITIENGESPAEKSMNVGLVASF